MKLSTKGRYATRAMLDLALHFGEGPILVKDISIGLLSVYSVLSSFNHAPRLLAHNMPRYRKTAEFEEGPCSRPATRR